MTEIKQHDNGHLSHRQCDQYGGKDVVYCKHIEEFIEYGYDAPLIWNMFEDMGGKAGLGWEVEVPIAGELSVFVPVSLVTTANPDALEAQCSLTETTPTFLGYLNRGEGRRVLREMLDNWLFTQNDDLHCYSKAHGFECELNYQKHMRTSSGRRKVWWFLILYGMCPDCAKKVNADTSDLVPDLGAGKNPF